MAKRPTDRDRQDIRRLLRHAGSREALAQWIAQEPMFEDFAAAILPMLADEEENSWKHMRTPEGRKFARRRWDEQPFDPETKEALKSGKLKVKIMTREQNIRMILDAIWDQRKELGLGQSKEAAVKRLNRRLARLAKGGDKTRR